MTGSWFALFAVAVIVAAQFVDLAIFHRWIADRNPIVVVLLMALLPLAGFPASVVFVVGGARFGSLGGLLIISGAIAIHLMGSYWITHSFLRKPVEALFKRSKYSIPQISEGEYNPIVLLVVLVPGLPYTAKNYLLALAGVPWKPYFWVAWPAHIFHASLGIFFGDFTADLTPPKIVFLACYALFLLWLSRYVVRRLKARGAAAREMQPGSWNAM